MDSDKMYLIGYVVFLVLLTGLMAVVPFFVVRKFPKTYWLFNLPVIIYPYVYMAVIAYLVILTNASSLSPTEQMNAIVISFPINSLVIGVLISDFIINAHGIVEAKSLARLNMIVKLVHIPAYILHFVIGMVGTVASIWGIGLILWAVIIDLITIAISGTHALSCVIGVSRRKAANTVVSVTTGILSYIYCVDVAMAIVYFFHVKKQLEKN
jgi:hypothetical protein